MLDILPTLPAELQERLKAMSPELRALLDASPRVNILGPFTLAFFSWPSRGSVAAYIRWMRRVSKPASRRS